MTKLRKMVGFAFVAMGLLTGFAISNAHANVAEAASGSSSASSNEGRG
jgi:hypothetical protein